MCTSSPKVPAPPPPPPQAPQQRSAQTDSAFNREMRRQRSAAGRSSTIVSGPSGVPTMGAGKTILGG